MAAPPELSQLLAMSRDRTAYQNPLFQAVTQMAYGGLPTYARQGTQLSGTLSNQAPPAAAQSGGGMNPALAAGLGGLGGAALNSLGPNGNALGALIDGIKKLFGGNPSNPYGKTTFGPAQGTGLQSYNPFEANPNTGMPYDWNGFPTDPSGGSGQGPGMQGLDNSGLDDAFRRMLEAGGLGGPSQSGGGEPTMPPDWWGNE